MEVAGWVEEGDLIAWQGIGHRRKRVREDAALRVETSEAVRTRLADMIRGRMENKVGDPIEFLREVKAGEHDRYVTGYTLREAIALADRGLLKVCVVTQIAGPWNNVIDGVTGYQITITEQGEKFLAQAIEARRAAGTSSACESAVGEDDASDAALLADICDNMAEVLKPLPGELSEGDEA